MNYKFIEDLEMIENILSINQEELCNSVGIEPITISRAIQGNVITSENIMQKVYDFAFKKDIKLNRIKEMLLRDELHDNEKILFHGAKSNINGELSVDVGKTNNDFGKGFYAGETYQQAISFVSGFKNASVYVLKIKAVNFRMKQYFVDRDWMMTIAYFRGALDKYKKHELVLQLVKEAESYDCIVAPIADNRMFQIIDSFINGEITDEQCKYSLSATNLGNQYIFKNQKLLDAIEIVDRFYLCDKEKDFYSELRNQDMLISIDKVKHAKIAYRGKGKYIDEILG